MRIVLAASLALFAASCTWDPAQEAARITHVVRLGDSYRAVLVVQQEVVRPPTGISTFPDGGIPRYLSRGTRAYLLDAQERRVTLLASQDAPDSMWVGFTAHVQGVEGDSAVHLRITGCPRGGECHDALQKTRFLRLSVSGRTMEVDTVPPGVVLPAVQGSRAVGERNYARFSTVRDTITVRLEEGGPFRAMFVLRADGSVGTVW